MLCSGVFQQIGFLIEITSYVTKTHKNKQTSRLDQLLSVFFEPATTPPSNMK